MHELAGFRGEPMRLIGDPPTPDGEIHALAANLRERKGRRVGLQLSDRCEQGRVDGVVMRVNTTSTAVYLRVRGRKTLVPLADVVKLIV